MKKFEIKPTLEAANHASKYKNDNPTKPSNLFYEVHAVSTTIEKAQEHFKFDFSELKEIMPDNSIGIRVYIGDDGTKKNSYVTFTKRPSSGSIPDDILGDVYLIKSKFIDLKDFRKPKTSVKNPKSIKVKKSKEEILTFHQSCDPDCPNVSLYNFL